MGRHSGVDELEKKRKQLRKVLPLITEPASEEEISRWKLCEYTNRSHKDLLIQVAKATGNKKLFVQGLGYTQGSIDRLTRVIDDGYWALMCEWMQLFIPEYENNIREMVSKLSKMDLSLPESKDIMQIVAQALHLPASEITHLVENQEELELAFEKLRPVLGTLAETKLWQGVAEGKYITWVLERVKPDIYGAKLPDRVRERNPEIKIIDE